MADTKPGFNALASFLVVALGTSCIFAVIVGGALVTVDAIDSVMLRYSVFEVFNAKSCSIFSSW